MAEEIIAEDPIDPVVAEIAPAEDTIETMPDPVVIPDAPVVHAEDPTLEEAQALFPENPGLDAVRTQAGWLTRDGVLHPLLSGE